MSKPITVTRTITETVTIGRLNYEAACPDQVPWKDLPADEQERWERGAAAVYDAVGPTQQQKDDEAGIIEECRRISAIWPHLAFDPSDPVVYEFLCELRETVERVDQRLMALDGPHPHLIGKPEFKVMNWLESNGFNWRVGSRDAHPCALTADHDPKRRTLHIRDGLVVSIVAG